MMAIRHQAISIKQVIRIEWMQRTVNLLLAGLEARAIRQELHEFLADRKSSGREGERSDQTRTFVVNNLMKIWVSPDPDLLAFRDASLACARQHPPLALAVHWGMVMAVYPFWFNVARHTGRLLALQDQVTQRQIIDRLKEGYGDRETLSRYARCVIRSFVAWGVLRDTAVRGCYEKGAPLRVADADLVILLLESTLHATPEGKGAVGLLQRHPALFPFQLPTLSGDLLARRGDRLEVVRFGLDDDLLKLRREPSWGLGG